MGLTCQATCDRCNRKKTVPLTGPATAQKYIIKKGWKVKDKKVYCPYCRESIFYERVEDDNELVGQLNIKDFFYE